MVADQSTAAIDAARGLGALAIGASLVVASTRAISARIATSAAAILFVVITVLAVALSAVITDNVEDEAAAPVRSPGRDRGATAARQGVPVLGVDDVLASALSHHQPTRHRGRAGHAPRSRRLARAGRRGLGVVVSRSGASSPASCPLTRTSVPRFVLRSDGQIVAAVPPPDGDRARLSIPAFATMLSGSSVIVQALSAPGADPVRRRCRRPRRSRWRLPRCSFPASTSGASSCSRASSTTPTSRCSRSHPRTSSPGSASALVGRGGVLASTGLAWTIQRSPSWRSPPSTGPAPPLATSATGSPSSARSLGSDGAPVMAVVLSVPRSQIEAAREDLYRVLFLVAMGAAAAALALAALVGERIGSGLRRLTVAATAIRGGQPGRRRRASPPTTSWAPSAPPSTRWPAPSAR